MILRQILSHKTGQTYSEEVLIENLNKQCFRIMITRTSKGSQIASNYLFL